MDVNAPRTDGCRVLVVEDDWAIRSILGRILRRAGYAVEVASCGEEALAALGAARFGLVMSDVQMPRIDGIELVGLLAERGVDVPVILLTALDTEMVQLAVVGLPQVRGVVRKPFDTAMLLAAVKRAVVCD